MAYEVFIDGNSHTCIKVLDGHKNVHVLMCDGQYKVVKVPKYIFPRRFRPLADYSVQRAAAKYLEHAAIHGSTDRARSILEAILENKEYDMSTEANTSAAAKPAKADPVIVRASEKTVKPTDGKNVQVAWPPADEPRAAQDTKTTTKAGKQPKAVKTEAPKPQEKAMATKKPTAKVTKKSDKPQAKGEAKKAAPAKSAAKKTAPVAGGGRPSPFAGKAIQKTDKYKDVLATIREGTKRMAIMVAIGTAKKADDVLGKVVEGVTIRTADLHNAKEWGLVKFV